MTFQMEPATFERVRVMESFITTASLQTAYSLEALFPPENTLSGA